MDNYTVKLVDNGDDYGEHDSDDINVSMNFYNSNNNLIGDFQIDTTCLGDHCDTTFDEKLNMLTNFSKCLLNNEDSIMRFSHCDLGQNSISFKKGIVKFTIDGVLNGQNHGSRFYVCNSEQLQVAFSTLCTMFEK
jgi:hypothetical protein